MSGEYQNAPSGPTRALAEQLCGNRCLQKLCPMRHLENVQGPAWQLLSRTARSAALSSLCNPGLVSGHRKEQLQDDLF